MLMGSQVAFTIGQACLGMRRKKCSEACLRSSHRSLIQNTVIQSPKYGRYFVCFTANSSYIFSGLTQWHHTEEP